MKAILSLSILFFTSLGFARITDNQVDIKISENKIELTPHTGFHFNAEAPSTAIFDDLKAIFKPNPKTEKLFVFLAPDQTKKAKLTYYVCDDKKTVCEKHEKEVSFLAGKQSEQSSSAKEGQSSVVKGAASSSAVASSDSLVTKPDSKMQKAAISFGKSDKPTLLVFSAPWCPACLRLKTETLNQKSVQADLKKLNVKTINIDLAENFDVSEKFHVMAIPTVVLLNKEGEEVYRWLDYQPAKTFSPQLKAQIKNSNSLLQLEQQASRGDEKAISQLGMNAYSAMNCEEAIRWLSLSKNEKDQTFKVASEVQCAKDKLGDDEKTKTQLKETLEKAMAATPSKLDQIRFATDYFEFLKEEKKLTPQTSAQVTETIQKVDALINDEKESTTAFSLSTFGEPGGLQFEELLNTKSRLLTVLDKTEEKNKNDDILKNALKKRKFSVEKPGEMLMAIAYLREAGETETVDKLYNQLIAKYPKTYVYHEKYARYLKKNANFEKALSESTEALKYAEGNEPQLHLLKANILLDMKNKDQALQVVNQGLQLENISHKKFKRTLAALEKLKKDMEAK